MANSGEWPEFEGGWDLRDAIDGINTSTGWTVRYGSPVQPTQEPEPDNVAAEAVERKQYPVATGVLDYFPDALLAVARVSYLGNAQHNPGTPLHWDRSKSTDEADALMRHFLQRGQLDTDGMRHTAKVAWRALALLQKEIERERTEEPTTP